MNFRITSLLAGVAAISMMIVLSGCGVVLKVIAPTNSISLNTLKPKFTWEFNKAKDVVEYHLILDEEPGFNKRPKEFVTKDPWLYLTIPYLKRGKQYYWKVQAVYNSSKGGSQTTDWAYANPKTQAPYTFIVSQGATGEFGFEEGQKEEVNKNGNLENISRFTFDDGDKIFPAVSKDGKKVAYCTNELGNWEIFWKSSLVGGPQKTQKTFSSTGQDNYCPFWMPDNENMMFYSNRYSRGGSTFKIIETNKGKSLTTRQDIEYSGPPEELTGTCTDNDRNVVYTEKTPNNIDAILWLMNLNDGTYTQLIPGMFPDIRNKVLVYCVKKEKDKINQCTIWTARLEGNVISDQTKLTRDEDFCFDPCWSPDGERIAFTSHKSGNSDIWVMDADGENVTQVTYDRLADRWPRWIDNTTLIFQSNREKDKNGKQEWDLWIAHVPKK